MLWYKFGISVRLLENLEETWWKSAHTLVEDTRTGILRSSKLSAPSPSTTVMMMFVIVVAYMVCWAQVDPVVLGSVFHCAVVVRVAHDLLFCFLQLLKNTDLCVECIIWKNVNV